MLLSKLGDQEATTSITDFFLAVRAGLAGLDAALDRETIGCLFKLLACHFLSGRYVQARKGAGSGLT